MTQRVGVGGDRTERRLNHQRQPRLRSTGRDEFAAPMQLLITGLKMQIDDPRTRSGVEECLLTRTPGHQMDIEWETGCGKGPRESQRTCLSWDKPAIGDVEMKAIDAGGDQPIERPVKIWSFEVERRSVESVAGHDAITAGVTCSTGST